MHMKLAILALCASLFGCSIPGARFVGTHGNQRVYEIYCPTIGGQTCEQVARKVCPNSDWWVVLNGSSGEDLWLECGQEPTKTVKKIP